jgi:hypothetical protein
MDCGTPPKESEGSDMTVQKGFRVFRRIGFDETGIRLRHVQAEVMEPYLLAADVTIGFAKVDLGMAGTMRQWHEDLFLAGGHTVHLFAQDGVAASVAVLVT